MNFKYYEEFAKEAENKLNQLLQIPVPCLVFERARGEIVRAKVSPCVPQIQLIFRQTNSKLEQTILYSYEGKPQVTLEPAYAKTLSEWQAALEFAFRKGFNIQIDCPKIPTSEVAIVADDLEQEETLDATEVEEPKTEGLSEIEEVSKLEEVKEAEDIAPFDDFIIWALENLRALNEDKASFKKDIPEEYSLWAATKRTVTNAAILTELANRLPVSETTEE